MISPLEIIGGAFGLRTDRVARAMAEEIQRAVGAPRHVLATGVDLGRSLAKAKLPVIAVVGEAKKIKNAPPQVIARMDALPFADGAVDAVCLAGVPSAGVPALAECARVLVDGGVCVLAASASALLKRVAPPEVMAAQLIHATLVDIEQRQLGSTWLTVGRVRRWQ